MKFSNFSHKTPHLKGKQHQLDPNLDLKQLVHHATVQYVDRDVDGDVDVYDNPKKKIPDENVSSAQKAQEYSNKLITKQKGEIKHTKRGMAYEDTMNEKSESKKCKPGYYYCFTNKECKPIPPGFMIDPAGMLAKENGHTVDEACWIGYKQVGMKKKGKKIVPNCVKEEGLRAWFGKSKSDSGKPGWVQSDGSPCANEPGETKTPKCFSRSKLASMSKGEIASAVRRKREQDPGQQSKSGAAKPTYVSTDSPTKKMKKEEYVNEKIMTSTEKEKREKIVKSMKKDVTGFKNRYGNRAKDVMYATATKMAMKKESFNENHNAIASGKEKDEEGYMASTEMDTINSAVKKLRKNIKKGDAQLPAWVQSKITKAADYIDTAADYMDSNEMSEESDKKTKGSGTKDACYTKVKSRYSVWPSAYASGALVKCRKVGAANWGNKSEGYELSNWRDEFKATEYEFVDLIKPEPLVSKVLDEKCWSGYKKKGMKTMFGKRYPNCVKVEEKDTCNHTHKGEACPTHGKKECPTEVNEATRLQADTGNILAVILSWRGKTYSVRMFFPQVGMPNRKDVTSEIQKIYPGALVLQYNVSSLQPGMPLIQVVNSKSKNYAMSEGAAWTNKSGKNSEGGLNEKGRKSYEADNPGSDLKAPSKKVGNPRRASFCARMKGMKAKLTSAKTARDPDSRINKSLRAWNC